MNKTPYTHYKTWIVGIVMMLFFMPIGQQAQAQINLSQDGLQIDYTKPKTYEIGGIEIAGIKHLDERALIMISGLSIGNEITVPGEDISQAIKKLWKQGLFDDISVSASKVENGRIFLVITLSERPRLAGFSIKGLKKSDVDNIREKIGLVSGDVVTDNLLVRTKQQIRKYFDDKGFLNAKIKITQQPNPKRRNSVFLNIHVVKNTKVRIQKIDFVGNNILSDEQLKSAMKETKEAGIGKPMYNLDKLTWQLAKDAISLRHHKIQDALDDYYNKNMKFRLFKTSKFQAQNYEDDKAKLIEKYNRLGYRDAKVVSDTTYIGPNDRMMINIAVDEGKKYYFRHVKWVGNTVYPDKQLADILQIKKGDIYNKDLLTTNLNFNQNGPDVSSLYLDNGYLFFSAEPVEVKVENDSIDYEIRMREGEQARLKNVNVLGNTRTNDHVIIRELRTRPGQLFDRSAIIRTQRELAQLKYFDPEKLGVEPKPNPSDGTVDIDYTVEETSSDQIELSGGWGYGRVIGTLGLSFNNFSLRNFFNKKAWRPIPTGDGQKLGLRVQTYGRGYISYSVSFTEPWLGGKKPNAFSVSYYHSKYTNYNEASGIVPGNELYGSFIIDGFNIGLGKRLHWPDDFFSLYQGIKLQRYKLHNYGSLLKVGDGNGNFHNIAYSIALSRNSTDQPIYPRGGSDISLSLDLTLPYSLLNGKDYTTMSENERFKWIEYHKWKIKGSFYSAIVGDLVLSTRFRFGFLGYYNKDIGLTPFERFYLGGDGLSGYNNIDGRELISMRGYGNSSLTPNYYINNDIGGTIYNKYTMELRYPVSLNPSATIYFLTFLEAGNSYANMKNYNPFDVYKSTGFGVRVFLPMFGMLGLDWGYGLDDVPGLPNAAGGQFHFSINQSID